MMAVMRHRLRKFIREIHRRSVWQVLSVYLALSWGVLQAVEFVTAVAALPAWTPGFAGVLLLIGLPVVTATAFVQKGIPGITTDPYDEIDPNELEGLTPEEVLRVPEAHPLYGEGILTWRNAILGAVCAAVLLIASVAAYLVMWTLGIEPVGSLTPQGVLAERDQVIVAEVANVTEDASLGAVITEALRVDLSESRVLTLVDGGLVADASAGSGGGVGADRGGRLGAPHPRRDSSSSKATTS